MAYIIALVTAKDRREAKHIAQGLLKERLIACANIIPGIESLFWWDGKIDSAKEVLLVLKTRKAHFKKLEAQVRRFHSYTTPEIISLPITAGSAPYLKWLKESVC